MINAIKYLSLTIILLSSSIFLYSQGKTVSSKEYLINAKLPLYKLKLMIIDTDSINHLPDYEILVSKNKKNIQTIFPNAMDDGTAIELEDSLSDINFDGFNDLLVPMYSGDAGKNQFYDCWLFNAKTGKFMHSEDFSGFCNVEINDSLKQFTEHTFGGCASECYTEKTFNVISNKPILIKKEYQKLDSKSGKLRRFVEKYKNGKMITKREVHPEIY